MLFGLKTEKDVRLEHCQDIISRKCAKIAEIERENSSLKKNNNDLTDRLETLLRQSDAKDEKTHNLKNELSGKLKEVAERSKENKDLRDRITRLTEALENAGIKTDSNDKPDDPESNTEDRLETLEKSMTWMLGRINSYMSWRQKVDERLESLKAVQERRDGTIDNLTGWAGRIENRLDYLEEQQSSTSSESSKSSASSEPSRPQNNLKIPFNAWWKEFQLILRLLGWREEALETAVATDFADYYSEGYTPAQAIKEELSNGE